MKQLTLLILIVWLAVPAKAQKRYPSNGDTINYVHCLFKIPANKKAATRELIVAKDKYSKNIVVKQKAGADENMVVTSGLEFGHTYYWSYRSYDNARKNIETSSIDSFYIAAPVNLYRYTITTNIKNKILPGYIVLDNGTIIDRDGNLIWFLPDVAKHKNIRNLNLNKDGNLTFVTDRAYEIDIRGNVLWESPEKLQGVHVNYHHDLKKLNNGNFLCVAEKDADQGRPPYSLVFEITPNNEIKWLWDEEQHYKDDTQFRGSHLNAASLDKSGRNLYISNRNLSSIMKIEVATGKIIYSINTLFSGQHSVSEMANGDVLLFNNNTAQDRNNGASSILAVSPPRAKNACKIAWEYVFKFANARMNFAGKLGDADELKNGNILVYTGNGGMCFEVTKDQEVVWECISEQYIPEQDAYLPIVGYRSQFVETIFPAPAHPFK
jgi:hypothetical protein